MWKLLKFVLTMVATFWVVSVAAMYVLQEKLIFPAPPWKSDVPIIEGFEKNAIATPDGETLFALFHGGEPNKPVIIVLHGNGDAAYRQTVKANALLNAGFGVLLLEYRGYPGSTGSPTESGLVIDALAGYDWITDLGNRKIGLYAHSLGTGVAIQLAANRKVYAIALEAPFDSIEAVAKRRVFWAPVQWLLKHPFRSDLAINSVNAPILIMHGTKDRIIPISHGRELAKIADDNTTFIEIPNAGHVLSGFGSTEMSVKFLTEKIDSK